MDTVLLISLMVMHYLGDFIFQPHDMGSNKYKKGVEFWSHMGIYGTTLFVFAFFWSINPWWAVTNLLLHGSTDAITSVMAHNYSEQKKYREFFLTIGADQSIHMICMIGTLPAFLN